MRQRDLRQYDPNQLAQTFAEWARGNDEFSPLKGRRLLPTGPDYLEVAGGNVLMRVMSHTQLFQFQRDNFQRTGISVVSVDADANVPDFIMALNQQREKLSPSQLHKFDEMFATSRYSFGQETFGKDQYCGVKIGTRIKRLPEYPQRIFGLFEQSVARPARGILYSLTKARLRKI